ncbi:F-box/kelch-repeat protein [Cardamine amara subsp. amara]|uniref:F-box/kelch-repeat protein n=1 Tax=Cardamine amara subsp. amara TaxID=228776 RepID=A0ABD1B4S6_CARAN
MEVLIPEKKRKRKSKPTTTTTKTKKKKKLEKPSSTPQQSTPNPIPSLPDDLVFHIIARISRLYYPTLSLVSKSFRSLLASPELYKTRSLLGRTESCFYLCLKSECCKGGPSWFTLCRKPDQTITNDETSGERKSRGYALAKVPLSQSPNANFSSLVAVGSNIYNIGVPQSIYKASSSTVSVLDCTSHTWRQAPSLPVELFRLSASVLDRKIYVAGRYADGDDSNNMKNTFQVFDTRTQVWDHEPIPEDGLYFSNSACIDGKFHLVANVAAYNAKEGRWDILGKSGMSRYMDTDTHCDIENVLYSFSDGALRWYDSEVREWRILNGLVGLPKFRPGAWVGLADYGGKMMVLWAETAGALVFYQKRIWCAEITLERRKSCEIWGKVEWFGHVLTVSADCNFQKVIAATV